MKRLMREELAPGPVVVTREDWAEFRDAAECRICGRAWGGGCV